MRLVKELYKVGYGPSSSHTMGPAYAAEIFRNRTRQATSYQVILYGSLAATGKGHLADLAIIRTLAPKTTEIIWEASTFLPFHPNAMTFVARDDSGEPIEEWTVYSTGGGAISDGSASEISRNPYGFTRMGQILEWANATGRSLWEYVEEFEGKVMWDYLSVIWKTMQEVIERGLETEGVLPGRLNLRRKARSYYSKAKSLKESLQNRGLVLAYALACAEENACGHTIVTAPTCGSCGVLPAVLYHAQRSFGFSDNQVLHALAVAGLIGNLVEHNASISGADVGCQGEIGAACSMASGAMTQIFGGTPAQVEYSAEMGLEHFLGLTCDPIEGLVQIPCIERNAIAAGRALDTNVYALLSDGRHLISFDRVVSAMKRTGHDLLGIYKETSLGGLAVEEE